jgi:hypothetical protein
MNKQVLWRAAHLNPELSVTVSWSEHTFACVMPAVLTSRLGPTPMLGLTPVMFLTVWLGHVSVHM